MAEPTRRANLSYEADRAAISVAGIRPLVSTSVSVGAASEGTYTITDKRTKRVVILHLATNNNDIRFDLNATATAADFPILSAVYFVVEVQPAFSEVSAVQAADVLHFYNTSGGAVTVYILEIL